MTDDRPPLLQGGRRRRRRFPRGLLLIVMLGLLTWGMLAVLAAGGTHAPKHAGRDRARTVDPDPPRLLDDARTPAAAASPERASRFKVDLSAADSVRLRFVRKPRAGLLFDVRTGRVLWRLNPERRLAIASLT